MASSECSSPKAYKQAATRSHRVLDSITLNLILRCSGRCGFGTQLCEITEYPPLPLLPATSCDHRERSAPTFDTRRGVSRAGEGSGSMWSISVTERLTPAIPPGTNCARVFALDPPHCG